MGDRVSIQFKNGETESVVLFHHWGGLGFPRVAIDYAIKMKQYADLCHREHPYMSAPLDRLEPNLIMLNFVYTLSRQGIISYYKDNTYVSDSLYFGQTENDGDNGDNGHFLIDLKNPEAFYDDDRFKPEDDENE